MSLPIATAPAVFTVRLADVSLTLMLVGAIVLAGATVVVTTLPNVHWPFRRRPKGTVRVSAATSPVIQRRVVTGRAVVLPKEAPALSRHARGLPDGRRVADDAVARAEAMIDHFLDTDPEVLAATMSAWIAQKDRGREHRGNR